MSRIAYFDCPSGISGDMALGALLDAGAERPLLDAAVEALGLAGEVRIQTRREERGHLGGVRVAVEWDGAAGTERGQICWQALHVPHFSRSAMGARRCVSPGDERE